jgi:hypothetical protein
MEVKQDISITDSAAALCQQDHTHRRLVVKNLLLAGARLAAYSLPFALTAITTKAQAQVTTTAAINALRFALRLEYLMAAYYRRGLATLNIPAAERTQLSAMAGNLTNHAEFLNKTLVRDTITQPTDGSYDVTGDGLFPGVLQNHQTFLAVAQVLEDTAVRAYKGLMLSFAGQQIYMTAALSIHSVRSRHAAAIRYLRKSVHGVDVKPWVSGNAGSFNDSGLEAAGDYYRGENNIKQADVTINGTPTIASEAFDEPLTMVEAEALLARFRF